VIEAPPSSLGATITTVAIPSPRVTLVIDAAAGRPTGVTAFELLDGCEAPAPLFATTENV
jgi:hypothetical protein